MDILIVRNAFLNTQGFAMHVEWFKQSFIKLGANVTVRSNAQLTDTEELPRCDGVFFWDKDIPLGKRMVKSGLKLFNMPEAIDLCDSKIDTYLKLKDVVAMPHTWIAPMTYPKIGFTSLDFLDAVEKSIGYPMVVKESRGSFGKEVYLVKNRSQVANTLKTSGVELIFQEFVSGSCGRDVRVVASGGKIIAAVLRKGAAGDFRSNAALGGSAEKYALSSAEEEIALKALSASGCHFAGIDLLFGESGPLLCELNSNAHLKVTAEASGIDAAFEIAKSVMKDLA